MSCPTEFPETICWPSVRELIRIVRSGTGAVLEVPAVLRHAGCVLGCISNMIGGMALFAAVEPAHLRDICDTLEQLDDDGSFAAADPSWLRALLLDFITQVLQWLVDVTS